MGAVLLWIVTTGISLLILYLVVRAAINHSVMSGLFYETRQLFEIQNKNAKAIEQLSGELGHIRRLMEQREEREK